MISDGMTYREVSSWLSRHGFSARPGKGSHVVWRHPDGRSVTVSNRHMGGRVPPNTIRMMRLQAEGRAPVSWGRVEVDG